jgi:hypothetical protein
MGAIARRTFLTGAGVIVAGTVPATIVEGAVNVVPDADNRLYATDYGVKADATIDDTAALQSAFDAASATGATLVLPGGTIKITAELSWKYQDCSIIGTTKTQIDARSLTTGCALRLISTTASGRVRRSLADVVLLGPSATATTVDAISHSTAQDTRGVEIRGVTFTGFRNQVRLLDNAFLWLFDQCVFTSAKASTVFLNGSNMGENISFRGCLFDAGAAGFSYLEVGQAAACSLFLHQCSFDFGSKVLDLSSGYVNFAQCHLEGRYAGPWITARDGGARPSAVTLNGGQIVAQAKQGDTLTHHTIVRIDTPTSGDYGVAVSINGTNIKDSSGLNGVVVLDDASGKSNNVLTLDPTVSGGGGGRIAIGKPANILRRGQFDTATPIATGTANTWDDAWIGSGTSINGYSFDTSTSTKSGTASGCAKFSNLAYTARNTLLAKRGLVVPGRPVLLSLQYAYDNLTADSSGITVLVQWLRADDPNTALDAETPYNQLFRGGLKNLTNATSSWNMGSIVVNPPLGAGYIQVRMTAVNTTAAALYIRGFEAAIL